MLELSSAPLAFKHFQLQYPGPYHVYSNLDIVFDVYFRSQMRFRLNYFKKLVYARLSLLKCLVSVLTKQQQQSLLIQSLLTLH